MNDTIQADAHMLLASARWGKRGLPGTYRPGRERNASRDPQAHPGCPTGRLPLCCRAPPEAPLRNRDGFHGDRYVLFAIRCGRRCLHRVGP